MHKITGGLFGLIAGAVLASQLGKGFIAMAMTIGLVGLLGYYVGGLWADQVRRKSSDERAAKRAAESDQTPS